MPQERTADRLRRILVLVPWVMSQPGGPTVADTCARFGITPEDLAADLNLLLVCGLPPFTPADLIETAIEGDHVVIRMAHALARPPRLTRGEAMGLLVMARAVAAVPGAAEAASLQTAIHKLARAIAPADAPDAEEVADRIAVSLGEAGTELLAQLREAIAACARLRIEYWSAGRAAMTEREVDPLLVFGAAGSWYLAAVDHASGEERLFRADRIRSAARTGATFEPPVGFDPDRTASGAVFSPSPRDVIAVLEVGPRAAWLAEVIQAEQRAELGDGRLRLTLRTAHLPWLVRLLLTAGEHARALEPPALVEAVRAAATAALARYDEA